MPVRSRRKGRGGQKQAELMELMAKAQADRAKRELEAQLREKGDLGKEKDDQMVRVCAHRARPGVRSL